MVARDANFSSSPPGMTCIASWGPMNPKVLWFQSLGASSNVLDTRNTAQQKNRTISSIRMYRFSYFKGPIILGLSSSPKNQVWDLKSLVETGDP